MSKPTASLNKSITPAVVFHAEVSHFIFLYLFTDENAQKQADDLGAQFTDTFIQDPEHVSLLLTLLEVLILVQQQDVFLICPEQPPHTFIYSF